MTDPRQEEAVRQLKLATFQAARLKMPGSTHPSYALGHLIAKGNSLDTKRNIRKANCSQPEAPENQSAANQVIQFMFGNV